MIVATRFNKETLMENQNYRSKYGHTCIYGSPSELTHVSFNSLVFVIEMNNSSNQIEGIGLIRNRIRSDQYYEIYKTGNYNRYIYIGNWYLNRKQCISNTELIPIIQLLDKCLFKGKGHHKRQNGFTLLSNKCIHRWDPTNSIEQISASFKLAFTTHFCIVF